MIMLLLKFYRMEGGYHNLSEKDITLFLCVPNSKVYLINDPGGRTLELVWIDNASYPPQDEITYAYFVKGFSGIDKGIQYLNMRGYTQIKNTF